MLVIIKVAIAANFMFFTNGNITSNSIGKKESMRYSKDTYIGLNMSSESQSYTGFGQAILILITSIIRHVYRWATSPKRLLRLSSLRLTALYHSLCKQNGILFFLLTATETSCQTTLLAEIGRTGMQSFIYLHFPSKHN
jgi:hypothetical protein